MAIPIQMKFLHNERRLYESRNRWGVVQVYEKRDRRELRFGNNVVQSAQSLAASHTLLFEYIRAMMSGLLVCPKARHMLHLGLGAGSLPRFIHRYCPDVRQRIIEINPSVIEVAYRFFDLPVSSRLLVSESEGREYLDANQDTYDLIFVDAFTAEGASDGLDAPGFIRSLDRHLSRGGWVVNNIWGSDLDYLNRIARLMISKFTTLFSIPVRSHANVILIGGQTMNPPLASLLMKRAVKLSERLPMDFTVWPRRMKPYRPERNEMAPKLIAKA